MSLGNIFDIAGSGMTAQSLRLNTTASNIANAETASSSTDQTYRARKPVFAAIQQSMLNPSQQSMAFGSDNGPGAGVGLKASSRVTPSCRCATSLIIPLRTRMGTCSTPTSTWLKKWRT